MLIVSIPSTSGTRNPLSNHIESTPVMSKAPLIAAILSLLISLTQAGKNPCHRDRNENTLGTDCEVITMPWDLCAKCRLRGYDKNGNLNQCDSIYKLEEEECKAEIGKYVNLNPCDEKRAQQFANYNDHRNREYLDYFVYSICEECCDCIPQGAEIADYNWRSQQYKLISLSRGNCPAHAHYDVCRVWPQIRTMKLPGEATQQNMPLACPLIRKWFYSPLSKNWSSNQNTVMDWRIRVFLRMFNRVARCRRKETWQMCAGLEIAQNRI